MQTIAELTGLRLIEVYIMDTFSLGVLQARFIYLNSSRIGCKDNQVEYGHILRLASCCG